MIRLPCHYVAHITNTETGETRVRGMGTTLFHEHSIFWWGHGNFECDCNRAAEFIRAGGREIEVAEDWPSCGSGRYRVKCYDDNGTLLYSDDEVTR